MDGAFIAESDQAGAGVVIRSHTGEVLLSSWRALFGVASVEEVEAKACLEGIQLAVNWEREKAILESDCESVIKALNM